MSFIDWELEMERVDEGRQRERGREGNGLFLFWYSGPKPSLVGTGFSRGLLQLSPRGVGQGFIGEGRRAALPAPDNERW